MISGSSLPRQIKKRRPSVLAERDQGHGVCGESKSAKFTEIGSAFEVEKYTFALCPRKEGLSVVGQLKGRQIAEVAKIGRSGA